MDSNFYVSIRFIFIHDRNFVPISLLVTLELVKFLQAIFISWDKHMIDDQTLTPAGVQASNLNEELG